MPTDFRQVAREKAKKYGLLPQVFERQIEAESGFNPQAVSYAGARGIAQIMPATARGWGVNPDDPVAALDAAAKNMAAYTKTFLGGKSPGEETDPVKLRQATEKALRAYNAGPGAVEASRKYAETNAYVNKIIGPDKFSFTEALGAQQPTQPEPEQASTGLKLLAENLPKTDPKVMLGNFILR
jgi:soluble lytic murein transglycosylase-like protein